MKAKILLLVILYAVAALSLPGHPALSAEETSRASSDIPILLVTQRPTRPVHHLSDYQKYAAPSASYGILQIRRRIPKGGAEAIKASNCQATESTFAVTDSQLSNQLTQFYGNSTSFGAAKLIFDEDQMFLAHDEFRKRSFFNVLQQFKADCQQSGCIVFVHGCCVSLKGAVRESAELSEKLHMPVVCFDWNTPSGWWLPELNPYHKSERAFEMSQLIFNAFMEKLVSELPAEKIVLVGHSMGCRMIKDYLANNQSKAKFGEVHFVSADMCLPAYLEQENVICDKAHTAYLYTSDRDVAMKASQLLSVNVVRTGRPEGFLEFCTCVKDFSLPSNRYFVNLSSLRTKSPIHHCIPVDVLAAVHDQGPFASTNSWRIVPSSSRQGHGHLMKLQYTE